MSILAKQESHSHSASYITQHGSCQYGISIIFKYSVTIYLQYMLYYGTLPDETYSCLCTTRVDFNSQRENDRYSDVVKALSFLHILILC